MSWVLCTGCVKGRGVQGRPRPRPGGGSGVGLAEQGTMFSFLNRSGCLGWISSLVFTASATTSTTVTASVCTCVFLDRCLSVRLRVLSASDHTCGGRPACLEEALSEKRFWPSLVGAVPPQNMAKINLAEKALTTNVFSALGMGKSTSGSPWSIRKLEKTLLVIKSLEGPQLGQCLAGQARSQTPLAAPLSWLEKAFDLHQMFRGQTGPGLAGLPASCSGLRWAHATTLT